jgi:hypothetical protein
MMLACDFFHVDCAVTLRRRNLRPPDIDDITTAPVTDLATARIRRRKILGGLINEYGRAA